MSFNLFPWEISEKHLQVMRERRGGFRGICCYDPFIEKIVLNSLLPRKREAPLTVITGGEISRNWLEVHLQERDFFLTERSFLILQADEMKNTEQQFFMEEKWDKEEIFLMMVFHPGSKFFHLLERKSHGRLLKIKAPPFWESGKLLHFLCQKMGVTISQQVQNYLLDAISHDPGTLINSLKILALHFPKTEKMTVKQAQTIIHPQRLKQFELAFLFGERKFEKFFKTLIQMDFDFETWRSFFAFMQGHLYKLADTSYIGKKERKGQYDKKILAHSQNFKSQDLRRFMSFFGQLEILSKKKSPHLKTLLRKESLTQGIQ